MRGAVSGGQLDEFRSPEGFADVGYFGYHFVARLLNTTALQFWQLQQIL